MRRPAAADAPRRRRAPPPRAAAAAAGREAAEGESESAGAAAAAAAPQPRIFEGRRNGAAAPAQVAVVVREPERALRSRYSTRAVGEDFTQRHRRGTALMRRTRFLV